MSEPPDHGMASGAAAPSTAVALERGPPQSATHGQSGVAALRHSMWRGGVTGPVLRTEVSEERRIRATARSRLGHGPCAFHSVTAHVTLQSRAKGT